MSLATLDFWGADGELSDAGRLLVALASADRQRRVYRRDLFTAAGLDTKRGVVELLRLQSHGLIEPERHRPEHRREYPLTAAGWKESRQLRTGESQRARGVPWPFPTDRVELAFVGHLFRRNVRWVEVRHIAGSLMATVHFAPDALAFSDRIELILTSPMPSGFDVVGLKSAAQLLAPGRKPLDESDVLATIARLVRSIHVGLEAVARKVAGRSP